MLYNSLPPENRLMEVIHHIYGILCNRDAPIPDMTRPLRFHTVPISEHPLFCDFYVCIPPASWLPYWSGSHSHATSRRCTSEGGFLPISFWLSVLLSEEGSVHLNKSIGIGHNSTDVLKIIVWGSGRPKELRALMQKVLLLGLLPDLTPLDLLQCSPQSESTFRTSTSHLRTSLHNTIHTSSTPSPSHQPL